MIKSFLHKGLERFYLAGSKAGIQPAHAPRLQLARLDIATSASDMDLPGWRLHALKGALKGHWNIWADQNWRVLFTFEGENAELVDYQDYH